MAAVIMLEKKLRLYVNEVDIITEKAKEMLDSDIPDPNQIRDTFLNSSMVLGRMISCIEEIHGEIQLLSKEKLDEAQGLLLVFDSSLTSKLEAEKIRCKIDAKLISLNRPDANVFPKNNNSSHCQEAGNVRKT